jgi:hypothetical protein
MCAFSAISSVSFEELWQGFEHESRADAFHLHRAILMTLIRHRRSGAIQAGDYTTDLCL